MPWFFLSVVTALAGPWQVQRIEVRDARGEWAEVPSSGEAFTVDASGAEQLLVVQQQVAEDARIVTQMAQVTLRREEDDRTIRVLEDSDLTLAEWGVLQDLGAVWYDVHGPFKVVYHRVEALVEGTRFLVSTDEHGAGSVAVARGRVRVRTPQGQVLVRRGRIAIVEPGHPPDRQPWRVGAPGGGPGALADAGPSVGLLVGGRAAGQARTAADGPGAQGIAGVRAELPVGPISLVAGAGLASTGRSGAVPVSLGVVAQVGPMQVGGSGRAQLNVVEGASPPGSSGTWAVQTDLGATLDLGFRYPVGDHLGVELQWSGGYVDGLCSSLQTGASWRF